MLCKCTWQWLGLVACAFYHSTWEAEAHGSLWIPGPHSETLFQTSRGVNMHTHAYTHAHMHLVHNHKPHRSGSFEEQIGHCSEAYGPIEQKLKTERTVGLGPASVFRVIQHSTWLRWLQCNSQLIWTQSQAGSCRQLLPVLRQPLLCPGWEFGWLQNLLAAQAWSFAECVLGIAAVGLLKCPLHPCG